MRGWEVAAMTVARSRLVDVSLIRWYHCISRCVRRAFLLAEGELDRKAWIERRLEELAEIFAVSVGGFAILDTHLHLLLRLDPERAGGLVRGRSGPPLGQALSASGRKKDRHCGASSLGGAGSTQVCRW
jgi:hypothetical protein